MFLWAIKGGWVVVEQTLFLSESKRGIGSPFQEIKRERDVIPLSREREKGGKRDRESGG